MDTKKLRQKILDLAIHGKLVPQDPNDEPASVLLERIKAEKERLIKEGKIKRSKKSAKTSDTPHYQQNVPFEVPENWVWCKLEDIVYELKYGTSEKSSSVGKIAVLRMGNITNIGTIDYSELVYSSNEEDIKQYSLKKDDLLFNRTNSSDWVGKTAIYKEERPAIYAGYLIRIRPILISPDYLNIVMNSSYYRNWCYNVKTDAVNQSNINAQKLSQLMIPVPPSKEQERIIVKIAKWISLINAIRNNKEDLQSTIKQTKNKILDLAIHGKLVPQDSNDEPAIELLKCINPNFTPCDNGHSGKLPQGWCTCKYTDIYTDISSKPYQILKSQIQESGKYPVVSQSAKHIEGFTDSCNVFSHSLPCILFGDHTRVVKYIDFDFVVGADGVKIQCPKVNAKWAYYIMEYVSFHIVNKGYSRHFGQVVKFTYALPPLAEQQRIVVKIEELFSNLDNIQKALEA